MAERKLLYLDRLLLHTFFLTDLSTQVNPRPGGPGDYLVRHLSIDFPGVIGPSGCDNSLCIARWATEARKPSHHFEVQFRCDSSSLTRLISNPTSFVFCTHT